MGGACSTYGDRISVCRILMGKPEGKKSIGRLRSAWEDNTKITLQKVGCGGMDWMDLAQDGDRSFINCGEFID
jgi:hypothetical protein